MNNKTELPNQVKELLGNDWSPVEAAEVTWQHAKSTIEAKDKEIAELKESYNILNNQLRITLKDVGELQEYLQRTKQGTIGRSVLKESARLLKEKDAMNDKLKGLLKE